MILLEQLRGCKVIVNYFNEGVLSTVLMEETILFCSVLASFSEGVNRCRLVKLDQGALKVLPQVGLMTVAGNVVGGWERRLFG